MIGRVTTALHLFLVFLGQVLASGLSTAWFIVRPGRRPNPGLLRIVFAELSPRGVATLAALITLTPGTTAIDVDFEQGCMLLHLLDASNPTAVAHDIHHRFELPLRRIMPARRED